MPPSPLARLRKIALKLPESHEVEAWGAPTFRVKNKLFAMYSAVDSGHSAGRPGVWIKAGRENQSLMLRFAPTRFFMPPYVGKAGWIGVYLDKVCDWDELVGLLRDAYVMTAPKRVAAALDGPAPPKAAKHVARKTTRPHR